jgi:predicted amidophosphoribosyltransferase
MSVGERRQARRCFCVVCSRTVYLGPADDPYCPVCTTPLLPAAEEPHGEATSDGPN